MSARDLRRALTPAAFSLWTRIRGRQLGGVKFVRQEPIHRYYVDFVCRERRVIIELDGGQHSERPEDRQRDSELCALGYRVIRIWNSEVIENLDGVLQTLLSNSKNSPSPQPSPRKRGKGDNQITGVVIPLSPEASTSQRLAFSEKCDRHRSPAPLR